MKSRSKCPEHGLYWGECPCCKREDSARKDTVGRPIVNLADALRFADVEGK